MPGADARSPTATRASTAEARTMGSVSCRSERSISVSSGALVPGTTPTAAARICGEAWAKRLLDLGLGQARARRHRLQAHPQPAHLGDAVETAAERLVQPAPLAILGGRHPAVEPGRGVPNRLRCRLGRDAQARTKPHQ